MSIENLCDISNGLNYDGDDVTFQPVETPEKWKKILEIDEKIFFPVTINEEELPLRAQLFRNQEISLKLIAGLMFFIRIEIQLIMLELNSGIMVYILTYPKFLKQKNSLGN